LEIGAVGTIHLLSNGSILANGGEDFTASGGGSGGGIFLHSHSFVSDLGSLISAHGGVGTNGFFVQGPFGSFNGGSGGGGGGRVDIETDPNGSLVVQRLFDVSGGAGGAAFAPAAGGLPGSGGQVVINGVPLPEPASLATLSVGLATVAGMAWLQRRAKLTA
jgi:hypothetical protein